MKESERSQSHSKIAARNRSYVLQQELLFIQNHSYKEEKSAKVPQI